MRGHRGVDRTRTMWCPECGSDDIEKRGRVLIKSKGFNDQRYYCKNCNGWFTQDSADRQFTAAWNEYRFRAQADELFGISDRKAMEILRSLFCMEGLTQVRKNAADEKGEELVEFFIGKTGEVEALR